MYLYSFVVSGQTVLGTDIGGWGIATATLAGIGVYVFAAATWITVWLMWIVFTRTGKVVDRAGQSLGRVGGTLGLVGAGRTEDAAKAAQYGPMSVITREGFKESGQRTGKATERAKERGGQMKEFVKRQMNVWGDDDGSRD